MVHRTWWEAATKGPEGSELHNRRPQGRDASWQHGESAGEAPGHRPDPGILLLQAWKHPEGQNAPDKVILSPIFCCLGEDEVAQYADARAHVPNIVHNLPVWFQ
mmetsp:Transcript_127805/g.238939  ORF Transcript_127805/g.238939 Transcript_127805/m.238939 type:complete len:104 (-) Transcript_127805:39-350(-)